jgi:SAM-dependent methyltransferase
MQATLRHDDASYYEQCYPDYTAQNPNYKLRYYQNLVLQHAPTGEPRSIVDVGCAFGDFLGIFPDAWYRLGVDTNRFAISCARKRFPAINFEQIDDFSLPISDVDVITAFDVLEHVADVTFALSLIKSSLRNGGVLVAVVPVYDGPLGGVVRALDKDPTHVHKLSRTAWHDLLGRDFDIVHYEGIFRFLVPAVHRYLHFHSKRLVSVCPAVALVCRKRA